MANVKQDINWKKLFDALGLNGTAWQWRILHLQKRYQNWLKNQKDVVTFLQYQHKICPHCHRLVNAGEKQCPNCQYRQEGRVTLFLRKTLGLVMPQSLPVSTLLLISYLLIFAIMIRIAGPSAIIMPKTKAMLAIGANAWPLMQIGEYFRLITCAFAHFGIIHLIFNGVALSQVGPIIEEEVGAARFFIIYILSALGSSLCSVNFHSHHAIIAGASGAIFGLIGFGIGYYHRQPGPLGRERRNFMLQWALYAFVIGLIMPNIDNYGHAGGCLTGLLLGLTPLASGQSRPGWESIIKGGAFGFGLMVLGCFGWLIWLHA
jgi:rhomboid protease GluP